MRQTDKLLARIFAGMVFDIAMLLNCELPVWGSNLEQLKEEPWLKRHVCPCASQRFCLSETHARQMQQLNSKQRLPGRHKYHLYAHPMGDQNSVADDGLANVLRPKQ